MRPAAIATTVFALVSALGLGCSHNVQTPPARPMTVEAPRTIGASQHRARFQLSSHGQIFGPTIEAGTLGAIVGLSEAVDVSFDGSVMRVDERTATGTNPTMAVGRVGIKRADSSKHVSLYGGLGGGYSPAGGMMASADAGMIIGYDNPYIVPFVSFHGFGSVPFNSRAVDTSSVDDSEGMHVDTPDPTAGGGLGMGAAILRDRFSLTVGASADSMVDRDGREGFLSLGASLELSFD